MRVARTRADVESLVSHLAGTYPPTAKERWGTLVKALLLASIGPLLAYTVWLDDPDGARRQWWFLALLLAGTLIVALAVFIQETATWSIDARAFSRRNILPAGNWSVRVADIHAIDYEVRTDSLVLITTGDRRRRFVLRKAAMENLRLREPELPPQGVDVAGKGHSVLLYSSVATILGIAAIVLNLSHWGRQLPELPARVLALAANLGAAVIVSGPVFIVWSLMQRAEARDPNAPRRYRRVLYGVLVAVVIGVAVMMIVLARKGLVSWPPLTPP